MNSVQNESKLRDTKTHNHSLLKKTFGILFISCKLVSSSSLYASDQLELLRKHSFFLQLYLSADAGGRTGYFSVKHVSFLMCLLLTERM